MEPRKMKAHFDKIGKCIGDGLLTLILVPLCYIPMAFIVMCVLGLISLLVDLMGLRSFSNDIFDLAMMAMFTWELISGSNIASNVGYFLWGCFVSGCCIRFYNLPILKNKNNS